MNDTPGPGAYIPTSEFGDYTGNPLLAKWSRNYSTDNNRNRFMSLK